MGLRCDCFGFDSSSAGALCLTGRLFASAAWPFEELFLGDLTSFPGEVGLWLEPVARSSLGRISVCIVSETIYVRVYTSMLMVMKINYWGCIETAQSILKA